jgi:hypothetical protein
MPRKRKDPEDWRDRLADEATSKPLVAAAVFGAFGALLGLSYASMNSTPEKRQQLKDQQSQYRRERAERERDRRQSALRYQLHESYFRHGPGKDLYEERAYLVFPAEHPFADGTFKQSGGSFGSSSFIAASVSAGARLSAHYAPWDARGAFDLVRPDGSTLGGEASFHGSELGLYAGEDLEGWTRDVRLIARLIAAPGSRFDKVRLRRPDHAEIREAVWQQYLLDNPHIAEALAAV